MLLQETEQISSVNLSGAVWFFLGIIAVLIILGIRKYLNDMEEYDKKETVMFIDLTTWRKYILGKFDGYVHFDIPVRDGSTEKKWAIQTRTLDGSYYIVPAYGDRYDMVMEDDESGRVKVVFGILIGLGYQGAEVIDEWTDFAFPQEIYGDFHPKVVPKNFVLCRPLWNRSMEKSAFDNAVTGMAAIYAVMTKLLCDHKQQLDVIHTKYGELLINGISDSNNHILSHWQFILEAWDGMMMERTTPLYVLSRLLHISPNSVAYSALNQAMNHGGFQVVSSFVKSIKGQFKDLAGSLDMHTVEKGAHELTIAKVNQMREDLMDAAQQRIQMQNDQQRLLSMIQQQHQSTNTAQSNPNPVIQVGASPK